MNLRRTAVVGLGVIFLIVFYIGNNTTFFGPYGLPGDNLHLFILAATFFIALLAYLFVMHGRGRG